MTFFFKIDIMQSNDVILMTMFCDIIDVCMLGDHN